MGRLPLRSRPRAGAVWREAGLRTSRSTPDRPPSQPEGQWLRMTRVGGSSLVTAAGPCRTPTGFPILPASSGAPRKQFVPPATVPVPASRRPATPGVNASCGQVPGPAARRLPAVPELPFCASTPVSDRRGRAAPNPHGEQGRQQAPGPAGVELFDRDAAGAVDLDDQQAGDEIAGEHEGDVDAEEP